MGLQERDYYRDHHRELAKDRENERFFQSRRPTNWWRVVAVLLACLAVYLSIRVVQLERQLALADRVIDQQLQQNKADRERPRRPP